MTLTTADLRKICDAATQGEWVARPVALKADAYTITTNEKHVLYAVSGEVKCGRAGDYYQCHNLRQPEALVRIRTEDASFIEVFQPTRVRAMLDEIEALRAEMGRRGKELLRRRSMLAGIVDGIEDEGDRAYFGSTNDADSLRSFSESLTGFELLREEIDAIDWPKLACDRLARAQKAEAEIDALTARAEKAERERDEANNLRQGVTTMFHAAKARAEAAEALVKEAGEALRPFAERVKRADEAAISSGFAPSFDEYPVDWSFPFSTLRTAAAFLAKTQSKERPMNSDLFFHIYEVPEKRSNGYCFDGAVPIVFKNIDWLGGEGIQNREQIIAFIARKKYIRAGKTYLVLASDPAWTFSFVLQPKDATDE